MTIKCYSLPSFSAAFLMSLTYSCTDNVMCIHLFGVQVELFINAGLFVCVCVFVLTVFLFNQLQFLKQLLMLLPRMSLNMLPIC